jgi:dihydroorotate dehydrogenase
MAAPVGSATVSAFGLELSGPVGLAAGFDRDGTRIEQAAQCGFAFVELGTITPGPVPGGNPGAAALSARLARPRSAGRRPIVGVNLGLQPGSPPAEAWRDYLYGMQASWVCADYLVLNFTSDAARDLREPARRHILLALLERAAQAQQRLTQASGRRRPLLVKWPVDPALDDSRDIAQRLPALGYAGMVAAFACETPGDRHWEGWVPHACAAAAHALAPATLVAVGGIDSAERAAALRAAGAQAVQLYRAFVTQGAAIVHAIRRAWPSDARAAATVQQAASQVSAAGRHAARNASGKL